MNTEKIEKLKKSLSNNLLPADLKPKIEAEIKRLEDLDSKQPKQAVKRGTKKTSNAKPSKTTTPKRTAMSLAKEIRKDGESWKDAIARASKMMKDKSHTATKDVENELNKLAEGGYLTDPTFGTFQNQVFADGGGVDEWTHNLKYLTSKKVYFDITTGKVYPKINLKPNMSKGKSIDEFDDKWFERLNDRDLATVQNYINNRKEFADGGGIPNNYEGRTPEDVWNNLTEEQREHFLYDHELDSNMSYAKFSHKDLPLRIVKKFREHISDGQYATGGNINKNTTKMRKQKLKKGDTVTVIGRRWFDRVNGNTYHTAEVEVNGKSIGKSPMTYGYDDYYLETGKGILLEQYDFPRGMTERSPMWQLRDNGVTFSKYVSDGLKRDLAKGGGVTFKNGREYPTGRNWTNDHRHINKSDDHEVKYTRKKKFELGGTVVTDLAGHTGGSLGGDPTMLDGMSGTAYTGLVGETGAMSSGEMFVNGGGVGKKLNAGVYRVGKPIKVGKMYEQKVAIISDNGQVRSNSEFGSTKTDFISMKNPMITEKQFYSLNSYADGGGVDDFKIWEILYLDKGVQKSILVEGDSSIIETNNWKKQNPNKEFIQIRLYKNKMELGGGLPSGVNQSYMITESLGNPAQHLAKGGGVTFKNGREYPTGRNWTNDHRHINKSDDHEVEYRRKKSFFAKGGAMGNIEYKDVLQVLKEKLENSIDDLPREYEFANDFKGEEVEKDFRDGFIPYTSGGYEVTWFEQMSYFNGAGYGLPTKPLDDEMQRQINYNYQLAKETFVENYPEIVEELGEENIDYNSLYEAGYESEAEELSEMEMNYDGDDTIMCEIGAYYYDTENYRGIEGEHTLRLYGLVNLESPYHRRGNLDDSYDIDITFDSISELKEKVDAGLKEIIDWFDGKYYNDSDAEMKIRRMADGGAFAPNVSNGTEFMSGVYADGGFMDGVYAKGGGVSNVPKNIQERLEYLRGEIRNESISYGEIAELQSMKEYIDPNDVELLEFAGVPEFEDDDNYAKGGKVSPFKNIMETNTITEKEINLMGVQALGLGLGGIATLFTGTRDSGASVGNLLTESGDNLVQEDGGQILLE